MPTEQEVLAERASIDARVEGKTNVDILWRNAEEHGGQGFAKIVDRKKELIITAGAKNISPANLEALLKRHPLVGQACVVGDGKPSAAALIVLDGEVAPGWAKANGVPFATIAEFSQQQRVIAEMQRGVDDANQRVWQVERIKRVLDPAH
jgi:long-chain acyl-CoA synthetase